MLVSGRPRYRLDPYPVAVVKGIPRSMLASTHKKFYCYTTKWSLARKECVCKDSGPSTRWLLLYVTGERTLSFLRYRRPVVHSQSTDGSHLPISPGPSSWNRNHPQKKGFSSRSRRCSVRPWAVVVGRRKTPWRSTCEVCTERTSRTYGPGGVVGEGREGRKTDPLSGHVTIGVTRKS